MIWLIWITQCIGHQGLLTNTTAKLPRIGCHQFGDRSPHLGTHPCFSQFPKMAVNTIGKNNSCCKKVVLLGKTWTRNRSKNGCFWPITMLLCCFVEWSECGQETPNNSSKFGVKQLTWTSLFKMSCCIAQNTLLVPAPAPHCGATMMRKICIGHKRVCMNRVHKMLRHNSLHSATSGKVSGEMTPMALEHNMEMRGTAGVQWETKPRRQNCKTKHRRCGVWICPWQSPTNLHCLWPSLLNKDNPRQFLVDVWCSNTQGSKKHHKPQVVMMATTSQEGCLTCHSALTSCEVLKLDKLTVHALWLLPVLESLALQQCACTYRLLR